MEGTPKDGPVAMILHANRRSKDLFGGGQDIFHAVSYDLLFYELSAQ